MVEKSMVDTHADTKMYTYLVSNIEKLIGRDATGQLLTNVKKLNDDYAAGKKTEAEWKTAVEALTSKAIPDDTRARIRLNDAVYWLAPSFSGGSYGLAHTVVPLKMDKVHETVEALEQIEFPRAVDKKYGLDKGEAWGLAQSILGMKSTIKFLETLQKTNEDLKARKITPQQWDEKIKTELFSLPKDPVFKEESQWYAPLYYLAAASTYGSVKKAKTMELEDMFMNIKRNYKPGYRIEDLHE